MKATLICRRCHRLRSLGSTRTCASCSAELRRQEEHRKSIQTAASVVVPKPVEPPPIKKSLFLHVPGFELGNEENIAAPTVAAEAKIEVRNALVSLPETEEASETA